MCVCVCVNVSIWLHTADCREVAHTERHPMGRGIHTDSTAVHSGVKCRRSQASYVLQLRSHTHHDHICHPPTKPCNTVAAEPILHSPGFSPVTVTTRWLTDSCSAVSVPPGWRYKFLRTHSLPELSPKGGADTHRSSDRTYREMHWILYNSQ